MGNPNIISIVDDPSIRISSPVKLAEGLRPRRVVLRELNNKFVVHMEMMRIDVKTTTRNGHVYDDVIVTSEGFDNGHYFEYGEGWNRTKDEAYEEAKKDFKERSARY